MADHVTPPAMQRDFVAEMVVDPPPVPPVDEGNDQTTIMELDADPGPPDLDEVVDEHLSHVAEAALHELSGTDGQLFPVRSTVRSAIEPVLARHRARMDDIRNRAAAPGATPEDGDELRRLGAAEGLPPDHPNRKALEAIERRIRSRGSLTDSGARLEIQEADAERDSHIQDLVEGWRKHLDAVTERCRTTLEAGTVKVTDDDRVAGVLLAQELASANPKHGLPILKWQIREAALDEAARGALVAALPALRSLYEDENGKYGGSVQLRALIHQANSLFETADAAVAKARLERVERTSWEIDEFIKNAIAGGTEALDDEGRPVLLPPETPPLPPESRQAAPYEFRRAHSRTQEQLDRDREEAARRAAQDTGEE
jgi:hypothetical protein